MFPRMKPAGFALLLQLLVAVSMLASSTNAFSPPSSLHQAVPRQQNHQDHRRIAPLPSRTFKYRSRLSVSMPVSVSASVSVSRPTPRPRRTETALRMVAGIPTSAVCSSSSHFLLRVVFLRAMAFVYAVAFWAAFRQNKALIGDDGITPARNVLNEAQQRGTVKRERRVAWRNQQAGGTASNVALQEQAYLRGIVSNTKFGRRIGEAVDGNKLLAHLREVLWDRSDRLDRPLPSLLWLAKDRNKLDPCLDNIALAGLVLSCTVMVLGAANLPILLALWTCQRSLMGVGGPWYGFGWEPQLAELGFHALFMVPLLSLKQFPTVPVPIPVLWTLKWFLFRVMMGAGLIKLRSGDVKWNMNNLTAMQYFYETEPVPNPLTRYLHWMPKVWHKGEVLVNHFVELIAPWLLIVPGLPVQWRRAGGILQLVFQSVLISSGNFSFLNWLTMVPAIACLDDALLAKLFSPSTQLAAATAATTATTSLGRQVASWAFLVLIAQLSVPVVNNLLSKKQVMNASFDPLRLVNTYGAFGTVGEQRDELIISSATHLEGPWREYEFKVKPGNVRRSPRFVSPYHHRLDWQMWIAATCQNIEQSPWMYNFLIKLLQRDHQVGNLMAQDPWKDDDAAPCACPKYIRVDMYRYNFHKPARGEKDAPYWDRKFLRRVYPRQGIASLESLQYEINPSLYD